MKLHWTKEVSLLCCQSCNGTVVPGGTILEVEEMADECGTVKTSLCKIKNRALRNGTRTHIPLLTLYFSIAQETHGIKPLKILKMPRKQQFLRS